MFLFTLYQKIISPGIKQLLGTPSMCRFTPSCSEYTRQSVEKYGIIGGGLLGLKQLAQCQTFSNL